MRRRLPRGLRPRLLLALLLTSAVTLGVAATVLLSPLPDRLREQSATNLRAAVLATRPAVEDALREAPENEFALQGVAEELRQRTDGRVILLGPVLQENFDFVAPLYSRHKYDGTITNAIAYPLTRALYGARIRQPIGGEFAVSGDLVQRYLELDSFDELTARFGIDVWMTHSASPVSESRCALSAGSSPFLA